MDTLQPHPVPAGRNTWAFQTNLPNLLEKGDFYDCTLRVVQWEPAGGVKEYKCHKAILSMASCVFEAMFSGHFKEAQMRPDEPITLQDVSPKALECTLRCVYGQMMELQSIPKALAVEVYKFAHKMQINQLIDKLDEYFKAASPSDVFFIFDLYTFLGNEAGLESCRKIISSNPSESLKSECWKLISLQSVQDVMQMDELGVLEVEVITALIHWGRHQVLLDQGNVFDGALLRAKISSCLQFIRFSGLSPAEFIQLCKNDLRNVLSDNEKFLILMCINLGQWDQMPEHLRSSVIHGARIGPPLAFTLPYTKCSNICEAHNDELSFSLAFEVSSKVSFVGLRVLPPENTACSNIDAPNFEIFQFHICYSEFDGTIGKGRSGRTISFNSKDYCEITPKCILDPGVKYRINFSFPIVRFVHRYYPYALQNAKYTVKKGSVTLKLFSSSVCANVSELLFELN